MEERKDHENKKIEIVQGDSKDLEISEVKDNLTFEVENTKPKKEDIVIPKNQK